jgi:hypothetical protein
MELNALFSQIDQALEKAQKLAFTIARGVGGREVALTITKL